MSTDTWKSESGEYWRSASRCHCWALYRQQLVRVFRDVITPPMCVALSVQVEMQVPGLNQKHATQKLNVAFHFVCTTAESQMRFCWECTADRSWKQGPQISTALPLLSKCSTTRNLQHHSCSRSQVYRSQSFTSHPPKHQIGCFSNS